MTFVIGLTGGMGAGKTTVAELFAKYHVPTIDADKIAHDLTQPHQPAFAAITQHFKQKLILANGHLDRKKLRHLIFKHPKERLWLENLLHPLIQKTILQKINALSAPYCIAVIPLLVEAKTYAFINRILVVDTPEHLQVERVMARDQSEKSQVESILKTQTKRHLRLAKAHDVIVNDGLLADLISQVEKLHHLYLKLSASRE